MTKHAKTWDGDDRTLCGIADEGECSGPTGEPAPEYAGVHQEVTCRACRRAIKHCRDSFSVGYRVLQANCR